MYRICRPIISLDRYWFLQSANGNNDDGFSLVFRSYDRLKCEEMTTSTRNSFCITNGVGDGDNDDDEEDDDDDDNNNLCQNDAENSTNMVDDFIELLVVHSEEMVEVDVNGMLNGSQRQPQQQHNEISHDLVATVDEITPSSSPAPTWPTPQLYSPFQCLKEEKSPTAHRRLANHQPTHQTGFDHDHEKDASESFDAAATATIIKQEPKEIVAFSNAYEDDILEFPEDQQVTWVYDDSAKEETMVEDECDIVYKCESCANTYENETLFQSHNCEGGGGDEIVVQVGDGGDGVGVAAVRGRTVFQCDVCDRVFKSKFVFKLHYAQHKKSNICQLCNACFLDSQDLQAHFHRAHSSADCHLDDSATATAGAVYEEVLADSEKQCDVCGKITDNLKQHKLYHAIKELEYCKAENKKFLKKWFYCQVSVDMWY